jgi:hypothetical protein
MSDRYRKGDTVELSGDGGTADLLVAAAKGSPAGAGAMGPRRLRLCLAGWSRGVAAVDVTGLPGAHPCFLAAHLGTVYAKIGCRGRRRLLDSGRSPIPETRSIR